MVPRSTIRLLALSVAGVLLGDGTATAGWICIKNESNVAVVLQETADKSSGKLGKVVRLLPGETYREYQPDAGEKHFHLLELKSANKPPFFGRLQWPKGDVSLRIRSEGATVRLVPIAPADKSEPAVVTASAKTVP